MEIRVNGFESGKNIPAKYTCDGKDISPEIDINDPDDHGYYILILNDPDAPSGLFTHWILYNIPADVKKLKENIDKSEITSEGFYQGINDFGRIGYGGPCPPRGNGNHRYYFMLYKTDKIINQKKIDPESIYKIVEPLKNKAMFYGIFERDEI